MLITFKNLEIQFNEETAEFNGYGTLTIPHKIALKFFEYMDYCFEYGEDEVNEWKEDGKNNGEDFECWNTDFQIVFFNWCFDQEKTINLEYWGETPFWLYHDFNHALKDVYGSTIVVDADIEEERIFDAINELQERGLLGWVNFGLLEAIQNDFLTRWNHQIEFDEMVELAELSDDFY